MKCGSSLVACAAAVAGMAGVAVGQLSFSGVRELGIADPQTGTPVNAGQVITGLALRYVISNMDGWNPDGVTLVQPRALGGGPAVQLPRPSGAQRAILVGASDDGTRVLAKVTYSDGSYRSCLWNDTTPTLWTVGTSSAQHPVALSADGTQMLLRTRFGLNEQTRVVSASQSLLLTDPEGDPPLQVHGQVFSPNGQFVAGAYDYTSVFQWNSATGTTLDQPPYPGRWQPVAVSDNGRFTYKAFWNGPEGPEAVDAATYADGQWHMMEGFYPVCQRRDGAVIAGVSWVDSRPKLWSPSTGEVDVTSMLEGLGINLQEWALKTVNYISPDGRKLVGMGKPPNEVDWRWWVATITPYAAADIGRTGAVEGSDGVLDNNDFIVFINRFFAHDELADVGMGGGLRGADGVFDNNDFITFISLFFSGEP